MTKYTYNYYETEFYTTTIEAESREDADRIFWKRTSLPDDWVDSSGFVIEDVYENE